MRGQHSDDRDMIALTKPKKPNNGGNSGLLSAFMPGQKQALVNQLQGGFGGSDKQWNGILGGMYSPVPNPGPFQYGQISAAGIPGAGTGQQNQAPSPIDQLIAPPGYSGRDMQFEPYSQMTPEMLAALKLKLAQRGGR